MAFCSKCGTLLQGDERFCVKCGNDVSAQTASTAAPSTPVPPVQPIAAVPASFVPPAPIPVAVAIPAQASAKRSGLLLVVIVLVVVAAGYYYYTKHKAPAAPQPGADAALVKQQAFNADWRNSFGFVQVYNARWTNNAAVVIQSATLECDQYAGNGTDLAQMRITLNGPLQPGASTTFNPFQMGEVAVNVNRVKCNVVY